MNDLSDLRMPTDDAPFVSVILPIRNEERHIRTCLRAVLAQDYPADRMEILVVDGLSTDGTREIVTAVAEEDPRVRLLDNPRRIVSTALNIGLRHARGDVIIRVDGHTVLEPDYVSQCVRHLAETGADNVGGPMRSVGTTYVGRAIAMATSHPFGVGDSRFHYSQVPQYVDTVYLGAYRREVFDRVGGFNEDLVRNQDYEFNYRLRQAGGRIFFTPAIRSRYYGRQTLRALAGQYFQYGGWKAQVVRRDPASTRPRHLVAPAFVLTLVAGIALAVAGWGRWLFSLPLAALLLAYGSASLVSSLSVAQRHGWHHLPVLPLVFATLHVSWGLGFWWGLLVSWLPRLRLSVAGRQRALLLGDLVAVNLAGLTALWHWTTRSHQYDFDRAFLGSVGVWWLGFFTLLWLILASVNRFYSLPETARPRETIQRLGRITAQALVVYFFIYFFSPRDSLPRLMVLDYGVLSVLFVAGWRGVRPFLLIWPKFRQRVVIVGAGRRGQAIAELITSHLGAEYDVVGYLDDDPARQGQVLAGAQVIGTTEALLTDEKLLADVSEVVLACDEPPGAELSARLMACYTRGLPVIPAWQLYETITERLNPDLVDDWSDVLPAASAGGFHLSDAFIRLADVALAAVGLIPLALAYPVSTLLSRGKPLWAGEERVGKGGRTFRRLRLHDGLGPRGWPALINVLRGEMSLVGPRPMSVIAAEALARQLPWVKLRHALRPGLTGWAQVHGAAARATDEEGADFARQVLEAARLELAYDLYYLRHRSLTLYVVTLLRALARTKEATPPAANGGSEPPSGSSPRPGRPGGRSPASRGPG